MFQLARFQLDILALWMEPMLTFCALEHQIVVGSCGPVYEDVFFLDSGLLGNRSGHITCGKGVICLRMIRWFSPGYSGFRQPLMNDQLDISEIFLKETRKPKSKKKKSSKHTHTLILFRHKKILVW